MQVVRTWICPDPSSVEKNGKQAGYGPKYTPGARAESRSTAVHPEITSLAWSPTSTHILATAVKQNLVYIFSTAEETDVPAAVIRAGLEGLTRCEWNENGEEVMCWSEGGLRVTIYSLMTGHTSYISSPITPRNTTPPTLLHALRPRVLPPQLPSTLADHPAHDDNRRQSHYRPSQSQITGTTGDVGSYFVIAERHKGKDWLSVYDSADQFNLVRSFPIATTDVAGLSWSPCGRWIAVWEGILDYALHIYSPLGPHLSTFSSSSPTFVGTDPGLGVKCVSWGPVGQWIGLGGWDGKVRIIEAEGWRCMCTITPPVKLNGKTTAVWKEPADWYRQTEGRGVLVFDKVDGPLSISPTRADSSHPNPKMGVNQVEWNIDGTCLSIRLETTPHLAYVYTFLPTPEASLPTTITLSAAILFSRPIRSARWNPQRPRRLALCTHDPLATNLPTLGGKKRGMHVEHVAEIIGSGVYIWDGDWENELDLSVANDIDEPRETEGVVEGIAVPHPTLSTLDIRWSPDGQTLSVLDKTQFCVFYDAQAEEQQEEELLMDELLMDEYEPAMLSTLEEESYLSEHSRRVSIRRTPSRVHEPVPQDLEDVLYREHDTSHRRRS